MDKACHRKTKSNGRSIQSFIYKTSFKTSTIKVAVFFKVNHVVKTKQEEVYPCFCYKIDIDEDAKFLYIGVSYQPYTLTSLLHLEV